jgi:hypothetical protein|tara:strand:+ start:193 stop:297 length:105 start_codon:yes stop_codon:yes gene_type:complete
MSTAALTQAEGIKIIQEKVNKWSKVYINQVFFIE